MRFTISFNPNSRYPLHTPQLLHSSGPGRSILYNVAIAPLLTITDQFHSPHFAALAFSPTFHVPKFPSSTSLSANIAVFGASGLTASECVYQALNNGDKVFGLTRNPSNLVVPKGSGGDKADQKLSNPNLTLIGGSATEAGDVAKVSRRNGNASIMSTFSPLSRHLIQTRRLVPRSSKATTSTAS